MDGFAAGLFTYITKDGQTTITAHIPFNGKKITLGDATADTDARGARPHDRLVLSRGAPVYDDDPGRPPLPTRLMAGLAIVKHLHHLSDEALCARWLENP
jgi:Transposase domain (DUF772)